ncbi:Chitin synthase, class 1 [Nowakowskiella sp. JEL0407]|nr:Chitin synthase, class 1 [Nowakowskiella sp. JEL0407]
MSGNKRTKAPPTDFMMSGPPPGFVPDNSSNALQPPASANPPPPSTSSSTTNYANLYNQGSSQPQASYVPNQGASQSTPVQSSYSQQQSMGDSSNNYIPSQTPQAPQTTPPSNFLPPPQPYKPQQQQFIPQQAPSPIRTPHQPPAQFKSPPQQYQTPPQQYQPSPQPYAAQTPPQQYQPQPAALSATSDKSGSSTPKKERKRAPPVDFKELPLPDGYYRQSYRVVMPDDHSHNNDPKYELRYTAATANWDHFADENPQGRKKYTLVQEERGQTTKLFVIVTMYNEDADLFVQTMGGVYNCIEFLVDRKAEAEIDADNIVVAIICDGRQKCPKEVKMALELLGCYQSDELIMTDFQENPVQAHLFEHTSKSHVAIKDRKRKEMHLVSSRVDTQYLVCMKEHNRRKIDSHGWAFRAFAPILKPDVCVLFDMGTKPEKEALYHLWMHFKDEPLLGGACGEIKVRVEGNSGWAKAFNLLKDPLLASQNFEYKMSNILDKSLQSVFGYITVLPGAFSAYRFKAIEGKPLEEYFLREKDEGEKDDKDNEPGTCTGILTANKYLAEDRILCFEVFTKADESWLMRYVKEARANTDAPEKLFQFLNQRRRWFNGSMFAFLSAFFSMGAISRSDHTSKRKTLFYIEMIYLMIDLIFSLLGPMFFYGVFITMWSEFWTKLGEQNKWDAEVATGLTSGMTFIYSLLFFFGMLLFVGNNPRGSSWVYKLLAGFWGMMIIFVLVLIVSNGIRTFNAAVAEPSLKSVYEAGVYIFSLLMTYGLYIISSIVFKDPAHIFTSMLGYLLLLPTYINMMLPFALSNIHDVSWGTRAEDPEARQLPRNKMSDGKVVLSDLLSPEDHGLIVDVELIEEELNANPEDKKKHMSPKELRALRKNKRASTQDDRNKNVRMILLLMFLVFNMGGAMAITYYGVVLKDQNFKNIYGGIVFGAVFGFAAIKFFGCVYFVMKTPKYKGEIKRQARD